MRKYAYFPDKCAWLTEACDGVLVVLGGQLENGALWLAVRVETELESLDGSVTGSRMPSDRHGCAVQGFKLKVWGGRHWGQKHTLNQLYRHKHIFCKTLTELYGIFAKSMVIMTLDVQTALIKQHCHCGCEKLYF